VSVNAATVRGGAELAGSPRHARHPKVLQEVAMATCARCGAGILWKRLDGAALAVDAHEVTRGPRRFVERDGELVPVIAASDIVAFVDHRSTCPKVHQWAS
jgi:hypothetical protein